MRQTYANRTEAGRLLAGQLAGLKLVAPVVIALPRGGVVVALEIARALQAPLDLAMVRKIGAPGQPELAVGAVVDGEHPELVLDEELLRQTGAGPEYIRQQQRQALQEIARRRSAYLGGRPAVPLAGRDVVVVDDGIATGASMKAALRCIRRARPAWLVLAVPVAPPEAIAELRPLVEHVVCPAQPEYFRAVGAYYDDFTQVDDAEVIAALEEARLRGC